MRRWLVWTVVFASVPTSLFAEDCSAMMPTSMNSGNYFLRAPAISLVVENAFPGNSVQEGVAKWGCPGIQGYYFPFVDVGPPSNDPNIPTVYVQYHSGNAPYTQACGTMTMTAMSGDGHLREGFIEVWENTWDGKNCDVPSTLAHEIGHVLGLGNTDSTSCGSIMDSPTGWLDAQGVFHPNPRSVSSDDCAKANSAAYTDWEREDDRYDCSSYCGSSCTVRCHQVFTAPNCGVGPAPWSPIVLDLQGNGYDLVGLQNGLLFDHDADGRAEPTGWTAPRTDDAFLFLDRNGNEVVDAGNELFGNFTPLSDGKRAESGFDVLAELDGGSLGGNVDGWITAEDAVWSRLRLWRDENGNARSELNEVLTLSAGGVIGIDTRYSFQGRKDRFGNRLRFKANARLVLRGHERTVPAYDVFFVGTN